MIENKNQSCWILILKSSQLRHVIELASQLLKQRRQLQDLLTEKNCEKVLANEKKLLSLTPMNETIAYNCRKLKCSGLIYACYSRNGIVHIKENEANRPIKVFHLVKLSLFPDHFQNNNENDQYHDVSIDANSSLQSIILI